MDKSLNNNQMNPRENHTLLNVNANKVGFSNRVIEPAKAISMEPIKERLQNLREYMPGEDEIVYQFGTFLANRLNPELLPAGFNLSTELAISDLRRGIDGYSGQPIRHKLSGYPPIIYTLLRMRVPDIAYAVCPQGFAKEVEQLQKITKQGQFNKEIKTCLPVSTAV